MGVTILRLAMATLFPVVVAVLLYTAERKTRFGEMSYRKKQVVIGVIFGIIAMSATQFGIPTEGVVLNVRDAAPLTAGLIFGGPSGIIAGLIGGIYRWFASYWGAGFYSQIACTIGTIAAGCIGAGCRKFMFDNKKASWFYGLAIGITAEVIHMLILFLTNIDDIYTAYNVVAKCAPIMIFCNGISVMMSLMAVFVIGREKADKKQKQKQISQTFQMPLLICVVVAFILTGTFNYAMQTSIADSNVDRLLTLSMSDTLRDIALTKTDAHMIDKAEADARVKTSAKNRHVGQNGEVTVCDADLTIVSSTSGKAGEKLDMKAPWKDGDVEENERFRCTMNGDEVYCMYTSYAGYYIITSMPVSEGMFSRNIAVVILSFMEIIVFAALFAHIYFLIRRLIVNNIHKINDSLALITGGNLNVVVNVRENEEFASLSDDINSTVEALKYYIAEAEARIDRELEVGRRIQHSALPTVFPPFPNRHDFDIYASMDAAKEVGGDFYDFYMLDGNRLVFTVADVSGKGIPGAMFMMTAKTMLKSLVEGGKRIEEAFTEANGELCANNEADMFVTAWAGVLNLETGVLNYVNAGHNPPLICRRGEIYEYLKTRPNFVLAGMEGVRYKRHEIQLMPGDEIFVYTDGVTEATDSENQLYGEARLKTVLSSLKDLAPDEICRDVKADIDKFVGEEEQFDDITMLSVRLNYLQSEDSITTHPELASMSSVVEFAESRLEKWDTDIKTSHRIGVALDEIYSNIINYSGATRVKTSLNKEDDGSIVLAFEDNGVAFDPTKTEDPNTELSAEEREIGGLGIFMVKKFARSVEYERADEKNVLTVTFDC